MQQKTKDVKSKGKVIGQAEYVEYDSLQEAIDSLGDSAVLHAINQRVRTNAMNSVRAALTGTPSTKRLIAEGVAQMSLDDLQGLTGKSPEEILQILEGKANAAKRELQALNNDDEDEEEEETDDDED